MNRYTVFFLLSLSVFASGHAFGDRSVYELTLKGKTCEETPRQSLECNYKLGKSLHVSIAGIGQPGTGIHFMKSDYDGDFYASLGMGHGCVIVQRGKKHSASDPLDYAFISPKNGKVYADWQDCKGGY